MYLGFWRLDARKPPPLLEVSEKYAPEVSKSGYTLHAELDGMRLSRVFERLLSGWKRQGYCLVSCHDLYNTLDISKLPRHSVAMGEITGRSGVLALQRPAAVRFS